MGGFAEILNHFKEPLPLVALVVCVVDRAVSLRGDVPPVGAALLGIALVVCLIDVIRR